MREFYHQDFRTNMQQFGKSNFKKMDEKIENIKLLLELNGGSSSYEKSALTIIEGIKHLIPNFDENKINKEFLKEISSNFIEKIIPIYDKYFTNEEILGIIEFYKTNVGKSYLSKMSKVALESMKIGNEYGELIYNNLIEINKENAE